MTPHARLIAAIFALISLAGQTPRHLGPTASRGGKPAAELGRRLVGRWENAQEGREFLKGGGVAIYRSAGERVYRFGLYSVVSADRVRMAVGSGVEQWRIKRLTSDTLVVTDDRGRELRLHRAKVEPPAQLSAAARCEIGMRVILTAEEQYKIDHAEYIAIGPGESFVRTGLLGVEPRCPSGGRYTVVEHEGEVTVHCSIKEHDFGGKGLR